jgi:hypothetical protein
VSITERIIKPSLGNAYNFGIINTDIVKVGTFSAQTPNILIKDINRIRTLIIRQGETIRNGGTTVT